MTTLKVQRRNMETKAKKLRREGYVTGNLFGKEIEGSIPLQIEKQEAERIERECMKGSQLYLELDGKTYDVLIKEMDYRPMDHQILEMDLDVYKRQLMYFSYIERRKSETSAIPLCLPPAATAQSYL